MGFAIEGKDRARAAAMASIEALEQRFAANLEDVVREIDDHIKSVTPVNTGQAVRNYIWTIGTPNAVTYDAIDSGPVGRTNQMALGVEPRRPANEQAAAESITNLNLRGNPFGVIYLTNLSPDIVGLEAGTLPGPPLRSRSPNGMFGITAQYIKGYIAAKGMFK